jgi:hypothetical protein
MEGHITNTSAFNFVITVVASDSREGGRSAAISALTIDNNNEA